jgi:hypothetical protein
MENQIDEIVSFYQNIIKELSEDQKKLLHGGYLDRQDVYNEIISNYHLRILELLNFKKGLTSNK